MSSKPHHSASEREPLLGRPNASSADNTSNKTNSKRDSEYRELARIVGCCVSLPDRQILLAFLFSFLGFSLASLLNVALSNRLGLGRLLVLGATIQGLASAVVASRPPFLGLVVCYSLAGFGIALQDAQFNTYIARLPGSATKLGIMHALYGVGALASPVAATLAMKAQVPPPMFYLKNLTFCIISIAVLALGFGCRGAGAPDGKLQSEGGAGGDRAASLRTVVSSRVVWTALIFIALYTGSETTESGWIVSFLIRERRGGGMSGYASAAFYSGLTTSRILLLPLTVYLRENKAVGLCVLLALAMQTLIWISRSLALNVVAVAVCGFVMGPVYPVTVALVTKATPHGHHPGALSLMAGAGQSGSALFPFLVGSLADVYGIGVLQPVLVSLFAVMTILWQLVPSPIRNTAGSTFGDNASASLEGSREHFSSTKSLRP